MSLLLLLSVAAFSDSVYSTPWLRELVAVASIANQRVPAALGGYRATAESELAFVLRDAGLVVSTRGAHGGYELARPPDAIPMSEVLRALEGPLAPMICATDEPGHDLACDRTSSCTVNLLWIRVRDAVAGALDGVTLADLVPPRIVPLQPRSTDAPALEGALTSS